MTRLLVIVSLALFCGFVAGCANAVVITDDVSANADSEKSVNDNEAADARAISVDDNKECNDDDDPDTTETPVTSTTEAPTLQCGQFEVLDNCPAECETDYCPKSEAQSKASSYCPNPKVCPPPQCKCQFNYRRAENGTCIPTRNCPAFECSGENEEFYSCPPLCPSDDCSQASADGRCPPQFGNILIVLECAPQCRCRKGYWRKNGVCVPYDECNAPTCGPNEILDKCPVDCPSQYCPKNEKEATKSQQCFGTPDQCPPPVCKCRINYRRVENGTCVPTRNCPPFKCSRPNEEFNSCPPLCPSDSCSQATPDGSCPKLFGRIGILLICSPKCRCQKGYWRKDGVCVPYADCGKINKECGVNEEYTLEKPNCPSQECMSITARFDCSKYPPPQPGCGCKSGFMRLNSTSPCIPTCQCPQMMNAAECKGKTEIE